MNLHLEFTYYDAAGNSVFDIYRSDDRMMLNDKLGTITLDRRGSKDRVALPTIENTGGSEPFTIEPGRGSHGTG